MCQTQCHMWTVLPSCMLLYMQLDVLSAQEVKLFLGKKMPGINAILLG